MKYYLLLLFSLPILSLDYTALKERVLDKDEIAKCIAKLPVLTHANIKSETEATQKLKDHLASCKEQLGLLYRLKAANNKVLSLTDKKNREYADLSLRISQIDFLVCKSACYLKNVSAISQLLEKRIKQYEEDQKTKEKIKMLVDRIAGVPEGNPLDTEKVLEKFYASLQEITTK